VSDRMVVLLDIDRLISGEMAAVSGNDLDATDAAMTASAA